jgi:hypothetical protein
MNDAINQFGEDQHTLLTMKTAQPEQVAAIDKHRGSFAKDESL